MLIYYFFPKKKEPQQKLEQDMLSFKNENVVELLSQTNTDSSTTYNVHPQKLDTHYNTGVTVLRLKPKAVQNISWGFIICLMFTVKFYLVFLGGFFAEHKSTGAEDSKAFKESLKHMNKCKDFHSNNGVVQW